MLGIAVLMLLAMLPHVLGLGAATGPPHWADARPLAVVVALCSLAVALLPTRRTGRAPAVLLALLAGTLLHHALAAASGAPALGPLLDLLDVGPPASAVIGRLPLDAATWRAWAAVALPVLQFAAALALTASLQTLMAAATVGEPGTRRDDADTVLRAHGVANMAGGVLGALPAAAAVSSTAINLRAGGRGTASRIVHAAVLLLALGGGLRLMGLVPMAAIAGVFIAAAWRLVDDWSRHALVDALRDLRRGRLPTPALAAPVAVMLLVAAVSVGISPVAGVAVGAAVALLQFARSQMRPTVRRVTGADRQPSRRVRPAADAALLRAHGRRIVVVELDGVLFFGTVDAAAREIDRAVDAVGAARFVLLDCRRLSAVDASGARLLARVAARLGEAGTSVQLAGVAPDDDRGRILRALDPHGRLAAEAFHADIDRALEAAEERLLAELRPPPAADAPLPLSHTLLGAGLADDELATLAALLGECRLPRGAVVFRRGDAGDALYVLRQGQVAIALGHGTASARRLVSFAPGVVFGEIGLMRGQARSADAVVEADAVLGVLDRRAIDQLASLHPTLHGRLVRQLALHLAERLSALTLELEWVDGRSSPPPAGGQRAGPATRAD
jgi:SulP family sulfate permease